MKPEKALHLFIASKTGAKSPATVAWYRSKLAPLVQYFKQSNIAHIEKVTSFDLDCWRAELATADQHCLNHPSKQPRKGPVQQNTLRGYIRAAQTWFRWMAERNLINANPALVIDKPPAVRTPKPGLSEDDRDRLIAAASDNPRDVAILRFLAITACRLGGVANLTLPFLNLRERKAWVFEKGRGGEKKGRPVYFNDDDTAQALATWLVARPDVPGLDYVFIGYKRGGRNKESGWRRLSANCIYEMIARYADQCGVSERWNPHNWRHGAARGMTKRGLPLQTLSQLLGHSSEAVTADVYGALDDDDLAAMHAQYNWLKPQDK